jgi:hypothetical protein
VSALNTTRAAIVSALKTLFAAHPEVEISATTDIGKVWGVARRKPAVFVIYNGTSAARQMQQIGQRLHTPVHQDWVIVVVAENFRNTTEAETGYGTRLGLDDMVELVRGIRNVAISQAGISTPLYLFLASEKPVEESDNPPTGGTVAYICHYQTQPVWV